MLELGTGEIEFIENGWVVRILRAGDEVVLEVTERVGRCVMTTFRRRAGEGAVKMNAAYRHNGNNVGVYDHVLEGGRVGRDDRVVLV